MKKRDVQVLGTRSRFSFSLGGWIFCFVESAIGEQREFGGDLRTWVYLSGRADLHPEYAKFELKQKRQLVLKAHTKAWKCQPIRALGYHTFSADDRNDS